MVTFGAAWTACWTAAPTRSPPRIPQTIRPEQLAQEALAVMNERKITCLFVTDADGTVPLGILHVHDCLRAGVDGV